MQVVQVNAFLLSVRFLSSVRGSGPRTGAGPGAGARAGAGVPRETSRMEGERGQLARGQRERGNGKMEVVVAGALGSGG